MTILSLIGSKIPAMDGQDRANNEESVRGESATQPRGRNNRKGCRTYDDGSPAQDYVCSLARIVREPTEPTTADPQGGLFRKEDGPECDESDENGRRVGKDARAAVTSLSMGRVVWV
jgi:hypothetical protein